MISEGLGAIILYVTYNVGLVPTGGRRVSLISLFDVNSVCATRPSMYPQLKQIGNRYYAFSIWILGYVFAIASTSCCILYLNNKYLIT